MPNWCDNDLLIQGNDVPSVLDAIHGGTDEDGDELVIDFDRIIPPPEDVDMMEEVSYMSLPRGVQYDELNTSQLSAYEALKTMVPRWYAWRLDNWGTKWNSAWSALVYIKRKSAKIRFGTAWSPPEEVIHALAKMFPKHTFTLRYYEGAMGYKGCLKIKGEQLLEESSRDYRGYRGG